MSRKESKNMPTLKVLMLTHSAGFKHDCLPVAEKSIRELGKKSGVYEATVIEDCSIVNADNLKRYDVLIFCTTGELPMSEEQKFALIDFVKSGKGFVGIHNATDTFYKFPQYGEMLGGYFSGHPWTQKVVVRVEDKNHPSTKHLKPSFEVFDEIYTFKNWSRKWTHVLISLDNSSVDLSKGNREDNDYAMAWCHNYGKGRVFYTGFGHPKELWQEEWFQKHLLEGIRWVAGIVD